MSVRESTIANQVDRSFCTVFTFVWNVHIHFPITSHGQPNIVRVSGQGILFICVHSYVMRMMRAIHLSEDFNEATSVGFRPANVQKDKQEDLARVLGKFLWKTEVKHLWLVKRETSQGVLSVERQRIPAPRRK